MNKKIIIGLMLMGLAASARAGWGNVDGRPVYFGQSGHWAIEQPEDGGEVPDIIWRGEGQSWDFSNNGEEDGE